MSAELTCSGTLELPGTGSTWVYCEQPAGHEGKHTGVLKGKRYRWVAVYARVRSLRPWGLT